MQCASHETHAGGYKLKYVKHLVYRSVLVIVTLTLSLSEGTLEREIASFTLQTCEKESVHCFPTS